MSKLKVLAVPSDNHGVGKYRILDPYKFIGNHFSEDIHVDIVFTVEDNDEIFNDYDIVVFHSFIHKLPVERNLERISWLRNKGIKVVMDIDDYWNVDQRHPMFSQIKANKVPESKIRLLKSVDYITCTTELFAKEIRNKLNLKNVIVFPVYNQFIFYGERWVMKNKPIIWLYCKVPIIHGNKMSTFVL